MMVRTDFQVFNYNELNLTNTITAIGLLLAINGIITELEGILNRPKGFRDYSIVHRSSGTSSSGTSGSGTTSGGFGGTVSSLFKLLCILALYISLQ